MSVAQIDKTKKILCAADVAAEVIVYPGAGHGFCVRGDPQNSNQVQQAKDAEDQAISWFQKQTRA
jgi:dienelactone hydrolase